MTQSKKPNELRVGTVTNLLLIHNCKDVFEIFVENLHAEILMKLVHDLLLPIQMSEKFPIWIIDLVQGLLRYFVVPDLVFYYITNLTAIHLLFNKIN